MESLPRGQTPCLSGIKKFAKRSLGTGWQEPRHHYAKKSGVALRSSCPSLRKKLRPTALPESAREPSPREPVSRRPGIKLRQVSLKLPLVRARTLARVDRPLKLLSQDGYDFRLAARETSTELRISVIKSK